MARQRKVRFVLMVPPSIAERYGALAVKFARSRSEVCRVGLVHGFSAAQAWCRRGALSLDADLEDELTDGGGVVARSGRPGVSWTAVSGEPDGGPADPVASLTRYADVLLSVDSEVSEKGFRSMVGAQAAVLGLAGPAVGPVVDELVVRHFPGQGGVEVDGVDGAGDEDEDAGEVDGPVVELD